MDGDLTSETDKRVNARVESPTSDKQKSNSSKDEKHSNESNDESATNDETSLLTSKGVVKDSASKIDYMTEIGVEQKASIDIEEKIRADGLFRVSNIFVLPDPYTGFDSGFDFQNGRPFQDILLLLLY